MQHSYGARSTGELRAILHMNSSNATLLNSKCPLFITISGQRLILWQSTDVAKFLGLYNWPVYPTNEIPFPRIRTPSVHPNSSSRRPRVRKYAILAHGTAFSAGKHLRGARASSRASVDRTWKARHPASGTQVSITSYDLNKKNLRKGMCQLSIHAKQVGRRSKFPRGFLYPRHQITEQDIYLPTWFDHVRNDIFAAQEKDLLALRILR